VRPVEPASTVEATVPHLEEALIRQRLARARFARLAFVDGDQPIVVPVNIATDAGERIVFQTASGGLLGGLDGHKVAIEIDGHDPALHAGWSVLVLGVARDVTDAADPDAARLRAVPVDTWAPGTRGRRFAVLPLSITGRTIPVGADGDWFAGVPGS
jgi:nitroimidazol reductase NimA-like FMN-containing flavoprotein (pyridoxamine 5'-phosphate oxidase superfamily)